MNSVYIDVIRPRISDINYGGHVGHTELVNLLHEIRVRYLHKLSKSELEIEGHVLVVRDINVSYKNQIFWNNALEVTMITNVDGCKIIFNYSVLNKSLENIAATAVIKMIMLNKEKERPARPEYFIRMLKDECDEGLY